MEKKFNSIDILTGGTAIGLKNALSLLGAIVLFVLTCWIPYLNIGTLIGLVTLPIEMAKGKVVSPTAIFDKKNYAFMGEFFLTAGLIMSGVMFGYVFFIIPGLVIAIAWSMALYLLIDKKLNPMDAIMTSNKVTTGYKWIIFLAQLALAVVICILGWIFGMLGSFGTILLILVVICIVPVLLGMNAYIYKKLCMEE